MRQNNKKTFSGVTPQPEASTQLYVIREIGYSTYWSNEFGWVEREQADKFTEEQTKTLNLPIGGTWEKVKPSPSTQVQERGYTPDTELKSMTFLKSLGIEPDTYPADACFTDGEHDIVGTYSKDRQIVCVLMADNPGLEMLSKEMVKHIAYTCKKLITDFGCEVHSVTMKDFAPFNKLTIEKVSSIEPQASTTNYVPDRGIELRAEHNEIWQRIVPVIGSAVFTPLLVFEHTPVIGKYTRQSMAEKLCYAWNNIDRIEELNDQLNTQLAQTGELLNKANAEKGELLDELSECKGFLFSIREDLKEGTIAKVLLEKQIESLERIIKSSNQ